MSTMWSYTRYSNWLTTTAMNYELYIYMYIVSYGLNSNNVK